jgi:hypothetical protein
MELWDVEDYSGLDARLNSFLTQRNANSAFSSFEGDFDNFDQALNGIDFSNFDSNTKDFKDIFQQVKDKLARTTKSTTSSQDIPIYKSTKVDFQNKNKMTKVIVPRDKTLIVENVSKFILTQTRQNEAIRKIGYDKNGNKLKELIINIENNSEIDFTASLFDPSMPLNYLYSTSQNLNDKINVQGGLIQYSDVLHNILANPVMIHNAYCTVNGSNSAIAKQITQPIQFQNKNLQGHVLVDPLNLSLTIDTMQAQGNVIAFNFKDSIGRPYFPDGMDVMNYTVNANTGITMCFYYEQISLKKVFYKEARDSKRLL